MSPINFSSSRRLARNCRARRGFTLIELLIVVVILGILASIVIPQFSGAAANARKSSVRSELQTLRAAIQLYRVEHRDRTPDLVASNWAVFTQSTDIDGNLASGPSSYGPYMQEEPFNQLANSRVVSDTAAAGVGWIYDRATGSVKATEDSVGTPFDESRLE
ncbi:MAG TPA: prepilin-type N-terminal cleavage/methylation domain-containing protein [Tepidisphaeraceae bacterium]|jgi:general secretion pathway protein G